MWATGAKLRCTTSSSSPWLIAASSVRMRLVRWNQPEHGILLHVQLVKLAEENGTTTVVEGAETLALALASPARRARASRV